MRTSSSPGSARRSHRPKRPPNGGFRALFSAARRLDRRFRPVHSRFRPVPNWPSLPENHPTNIPASGPNPEPVPPMAPEEEQMTTVAMTVNGKPVTADIDPRVLLVQFVRENLRLTGTHVGCVTSQCGACVLHVDGKAVKSCTVLALQCDGSQVTTIEGLANGAELHPM